jgi:hypothetical protein
MNPCGPDVKQIDAKDGRYLSTASAAMRGECFNSTMFGSVESRGVKRRPD